MPGCGNVGNIEVCWIALAPMAGYAGEAPGRFWLGFRWAMLLELHLDLVFGELPGV